MAVTLTQIILPARPSLANGLFIDKRRPVTMFYFVKLNTDITLSLDTKLEWLKELIMLDADGVTALAPVYTQGSGAPGTFTTVMSSLGAGLTGFFICVGNKPTH